MFQKAIAVRRALAEEPGGDDNVKLDLARNLRSGGWLLEGMSDRPAAKASYEEALAIVKRLKPADGMTEPLYRVEARITHSIGWLYHAMGKEEESVAWLRKACEIVDKGIAATPGGAGSRRTRNRSCSSRARSTRSAARWGRSAGHPSRWRTSERALEVTRKLAADDPDDPTILNSLRRHLLQHRRIAPEHGPAGRCLLGVPRGAGHPREAGQRTTPPSSSIAGSRPAA